MTYVHGMMKKGKIEIRVVGQRELHVNCYPHLILLHDLIYSHNHVYRTLLAVQLILQNKSLLAKLNSNSLYKTYKWYYQTTWFLELGGSMPHSKGLSNNPYSQLYQSNSSYWYYSFKILSKSLVHVGLTNSIAYGT
jgi:hypothetical protein